MSVKKSLIVGSNGRPGVVAPTVICLLAAFFLSCDKIPEYCGDGHSLNSATQFCHGGISYDKCVGNAYDPVNQACEDDVLKDRCEGSNSFFSPATEFCIYGGVYGKCAGAEYDPVNQRCDDDILKIRCEGGNEFHNPATEFCSGGRRYGKCAGEEYNPTTEVCMGNTTIHTICGGDRSVLRGFPCDGYILTTNAAPANGGTIERSPNTPNYAPGALVGVTATPAAGYTFIGWSGASESTERTVSVTMDGDRSLIAIFNQVSEPNATTHNLMITVIPEGGGTIERNPDQPHYATGTPVTVTAIPATGYRFTGWNGAATSAQPGVVINMDGNKALIANFQLQTYTLTTNANPAGGGTVTYFPISSPGLPTGTYTAGTQVTVSARLTAGYIFDGWSGASTSISTTTTVTMNSDQTLIANFQQQISGGQFNSNINYGSFTDSRDGHSYRTVVIGAQTWMAENLNFNANGSVCNDDNLINCSIYGRLYDWATAMRLGSNCNSGTCASQVQAMHQGICPAGWYVPTDAEWTTLTNYVGSGAGTKLKSQRGWGSNGNTSVFGNGSDDYGFSALPRDNGTHTPGMWWSATESGFNYAFDRFISGSSVERTVTVSIADGPTWSSGSWDGRSKSAHISLRCIQIPQYSLTTDVAPTGGGTISRNPNQTNYNAGTQVLVTATANQGYRFTEWTGATTSANASVTITMNSNQALIANFQPVYTLTANANPTAGGTVTPTSQPNITAGTALNISATINEGYRFVNWTVTSGGTVANANNAVTTVTLTANATVTANFELLAQRGTFTDSRDGQNYDWVRIGTQVWMAENLNLDTTGSVCYYNDPSICEIYGRLYDWATTMGFESGCNTNSCVSQVQTKHRGICPVGWHVPSEAEWTTLTDYVGSSAGTKLKSASGWVSGGNGTNDYGFSAMPGGFRTTNGSFFRAGNNGNWWSATDFGSTNAGARDMGWNHANVGRFGMDKPFFYSLRCVAD